MESQDTEKLLKDYREQAQHRDIVVANHRNAVASTQAQAIAPSIIPNPVSMMDVQLKATAFQFKMQEVIKILDGNTVGPHLEILKQDKFFSQLYIDKESIGRLNTIAMNSNFNCFGIYFGLEDPDTKAPLKDLKDEGFGRLTVCFVGLDENMKVLEDHFPPTATRPYSVKAEDTWPPPPPPNNPVNTFNLTNDSNKVFAFFNAPVAVGTPA